MSRYKQQFRRHERALKSPAPGVGKRRILSVRRSGDIKPMVSIFVNTTINSMCQTV
jgi:hypothetical protein